ncbi:MAG: hypothetical protein J6S14_15875 [Clostridia bacterium]|nr:hypothetical protein [Clostridia bacterium]
MNNKSSSGLGICGVLTIIFVVLKLVGVISWSWWWVLSPLWIDLLLAVVLLVLYGIASAASERRRKRIRRNRWRH